MKTILTALLAVFALSGPAGAGEPVVAGTTESLHSKVLGEDRALFVHTPAPCEGAGTRCPVLYLTDGDAQFLHTVATTTFLARTNLMPPVIVVGLSNTDRTRDLTPTRSSPTVAGRRQPALPTSGGADTFLRFIETELVPHVERRHAAPPYRIFCGHSLGGLFALHALFSRPDLFNALVAVSPTLMWDDDLPLRRAREFFRGRSELRRTLVVTAGAEGPEMEQAFGEMRRILQGTLPRDFVSATLLFEDEDHGSVVLRSHYAALRKIFEGWRPPVDPITGALEGGLETIRKHYAQLSERFAYPVKPAEGLVNNIGYAEMARNQPARALEAFRLNVSNYPASANVHDSLGECLEATGSLREARDSFARAVALGEKTRDPSLPIFRQHLAAAEGKLKP